MKLAYSLVVWIVYKAAITLVLSTTTQGVSVNSVFEAWPGERFTTAALSGEFTVRGREGAVRYACLVRCLQHARCGSVSVKDTKPYRCLWSQYAFYTKHMRQSAQGWAIYTRNKGKVR